MMDVSHETPAETEKRLRVVIRRAEVKFYEGAYAFAESAISDGPPALHPDALAAIRDEEVWSQLVPAAGKVAGSVGLLRFHFPAGADNSGFVGWLASHIKATTGSGIFVICGQNSGRGGIFDYWGFPLEVKDAVIAEVEKLMKGEQ
ncbi:MAG: hypothetical protein H7X89_06625 [Rhizobiales bacterium]|nr:hypothetical protein [Hyphomicrobiales bacterium]